MSTLHPRAIRDTAAASFIFVLKDPYQSKYVKAFVRDVWKTDIRNPLVMRNHYLHRHCAFAHTVTCAHGYVLEYGYVSFRLFLNDLVSWLILDFLSVNEQLSYFMLSPHDGGSQPING